MLKHLRHGFFRLAAGLLVASTSMGVSHASGLIGTTVTVTFNSPVLGVALSDNVTVVSPGVEIAAGDTTNIGIGALMSNVEHEFVDIDALTISLRLLNGDPDGAGTGWGASAAYAFSGFAIPGFDVIDATITSNAGFSNFDSGWLTFNSSTHVATLAIDSMLFSGAITAQRYGDITITLQTCATGSVGCGAGGGGTGGGGETGGGGGGGGENGGGQVPEPASPWLVAMGLVAAARLRRRGPGLAVA